MASDRLHRLVDQQFVYSRCRGCKLVFLSERPTEAAAPALYPDDYASYVAQGPLRAAPVPPLARPLAALSRAQSRRPLDLVPKVVARAVPDRLPPALARLYSPPGEGATVLDYGCGRTDVLDRARDQGWDHTIGVDFTTSVLAAVAAAGHRAVAASRLDAEVADASVELVRLNHVLEHVYDPLGLLTLLRRKTAPGGAVHVVVPNGASAWAALFRGRWFNSDPRHLSLFRPAHVRSLSARAGFGKVQVLHETTSRDIVRSWGYRLEDRGRIAHEQVQALADDPARARLLWYPARASAVLGVGDRFHAVLLP